MHVKAAYLVSVKSCLAPFVFWQSHYPDTATIRSHLQVVQGKDPIQAYQNVN